ncbi:hypothetical protein AB0M28_20120 [Streptomyces sp. NPDC051940]|uniref:hypothetical protein n=1 Tax=Streptomyces sp. NPDC051940 TaxID=3155675 RepID=UPI0034292419
MKIVRYRTREDAADENQRLVEQVLAELNTKDPGGLRYASFRLADGVSFVHVVISEDGSDPLAKSAAFAEFQTGIGDRLVAPPEVAEASLIGSYRILT